MLVCECQVSTAGEGRVRRSHREFTPALVAPPTVHPPAVASAGPASCGGTADRDPVAHTRAEVVRNSSAGRCSHDPRAPDEHSAPARNAAPRPGRLWQAPPL